MQRGGQLRDGTAVRCLVVDSETDQLSAVCWSTPRRIGYPLFGGQLRDGSAIRCLLVNSETDQLSAVCWSTPRRIGYPLFGGQLRDGSAIRCLLVNSETDRLSVVWWIVGHLPAWFQACSRNTLYHRAGNSEASLNTNT